VAASPAEVFGRCYYGLGKEDSLHFFTDTEIETVSPCSSMASFSSSTSLSSRSSPCEGSSWPKNNGNKRHKSNPVTPFRSIDDITTPKQTGGSQLCKTDGIQDDTNPNPTLHVAQGMHAESPSLGTSLSQEAESELACGGDDGIDCGGAVRKKLDNILKKFDIGMMKNLLVISTSAVRIHEQGVQKRAWESGECCLRERVVQQARRFLYHPSVSIATKESKNHFLKIKGLTDAEIIAAEANPFWDLSSNESYGGRGDKTCSRLRHV